MAQKSMLMNMTGESDSEFEEPVDEMGYEDEYAEDESYEDEEYDEEYDDFDDEMYEAGAPEEPDVLEPGLGMAGAYRTQLQEVDYSFNPVMDNPEISEDERLDFNATSDPYTMSMMPSMDMGQMSQSPMGDMRVEETNRLAEKQKARALQTARFQDLANKPRL